MTYLDVTPMVVSLRTQPSDFEFKQGWVTHVPSRHRFKVDSEGNVRMDAECDCAQLSVRREQGMELRDALQVWQSAYWRPLEVNRQFAAHFRPPGAWRRLFRDLRMAWRRFRWRDEQSFSGETGLATAE